MGYRLALDSAALADEGTISFLVKTEVARGERRGVAVNAGGKLGIDWSDGKRETLTAASASDLFWRLSEYQLSRSEAKTGAPKATASKTDDLAEARGVFFAALAEHPAKVAAARASREAELQKIGAATRGGSVERSTDIPADRAERVEQLRAVGRAVSGLRG